MTDEQKEQVMEAACAQCFFGVMAPDQEELDRFCAECRIEKLLYGDN